MKLVALNNLFVVAVEKNGSINLDVEHDRVISVPDNEKVELGWSYVKPPFPEAPVKLFYSGKVAEDFVFEPVLQYQDDGNGNSVLVTTEQQTT